jgi:hypothetical protein
MTWDNTCLFPGPRARMADHPKTLTERPTLPGWFEQYPARSGLVFLVGNIWEIDDEFHGKFHVASGKR